MNGNGDPHPAAGDPGHIRNVALVGPQSVGKTMLIEAMLHAAGASHRLGTVQDGTTISDHTDAEKRLGHSVHLTVASFDLKDAELTKGEAIAINLIEVSPSDIAGRSSLDEIETLVSQKLSAATLMTRVIANRMRLTLTEGLVLNVVLMAPATNDAEQAFTGILRAALATVTRREAQTWADKAIRINAIGPRGAIDEAQGGACLTSGTDIAALALYLASRKGRQLTGHIFDAEGVAAAGC